MNSLSMSALLSMIPQVLNNLSSLSFDGVKQEMITWQIKLMSSAGLSLSNFFQFNSTTHFALFTSSQSFPPIRGSPNNCIPEARSLIMPLLISMVGENVVEWRGESLLVGIQHHHVSPERLLRGQFLPCLIKGEGAWSDTQLSQW